MFTHILLQYEILLYTPYTKYALISKMYKFVFTVQWSVLKIYTKERLTLTLISFSTCAYQFTIHFKLNSKNTIYWRPIFMCSLRGARMEFSNKEKSLYVYVYLFVRVHVHIFNALMGLSPYILINNKTKNLLMYWHSFLPNFITTLLLKIELKQKINFEFIPNRIGNLLVTSTFVHNV